MRKILPIQILAATFSKSKIKTITFLEETQTTDWSVTAGFVVDFWALTQDIDTFNGAHDRMPLIANACCARDHTAYNETTFYPDSQHFPQ